jgi:hypothetical protein
MKRRLILIMAAASILRPAVVSAAGEREYAFISYPLEKIRPEEVPQPSSAAVVRLAGNEYEALVIGVRNSGGRPLAVSGLSIRAPAQGSASVSVGRIDYIPVVQSSQWFSFTAGRWPDPVIPIAASAPVPGGDGASETAFTLEKPVDVPAGENRTFLIEVYLPPGAREREDLAVEILLADGRSFGLDMRVVPWGFDLPRGTAMATSFSFSGSSIQAKHRSLSTTDFNADDLALQYFHLLSRFRVSIAQPYEGSPGVKNPDGTLGFQWKDFDDLTGKLLDGTLFPDAPPATSFKIPNPPSGLSAEQLELFYREVVAHAREKGWLPRMYKYLADEPLVAEYPAVREAGLAVKKMDPGIRNLLTEPFVPSLEGAVDIWCPDIPYIGDSLPLMPVAARWPYRLFVDPQLNPSPSVYGDRRALGEGAWVYTCMSALFLDFPNFFIDSRAAYARAIPWLMFRWGFTGLLYWQTTYSYAKAEDPWTTQYQILANGEGNLLYPGTPGRPDISAHCPIPSLRLYIIRDGIEDYQYLAMLGEKNGSEAARRLAKTAANTALDWKHDVGSIQAARAEAAARILGNHQ